VSKSPGPIDVTLTVPIGIEVFTEVGLSHGSLLEWEWNNVGDPLVNHLIQLKRATRFGEAVGWSRLKRASHRDGGSTWWVNLVVEERYLPRPARVRLYAASVTLVVIGLAAFIVLLVAVLTHTGFERLDKPIEDWFDAQ
jgi:hypothetical protein